ncbi:hypothetical protein EDC94DRAFT_583113 [Helicostylum pulchrum]|nr:hypothetical protein EDC94DRAFT_583113 [Helicostylum pulchrum]
MYLVPMSSGCQKILFYYKKRWNYTEMNLLALQVLSIIRTIVVIKDLLKLKDTAESQNTVVVLFFPVRKFKQDKITILAIIITISCIDIHTTIADRNLFIWIDSVGIRLELGFMEKAGRIQEAYIYFQRIDRYEVHPNAENKMTKYFKLLNAFRGTQRTYCEAEFAEPNEVYPPDCVFQYNSSGKLCTIMVTIFMVLIMRTRIYLTKPAQLFKN